MISSCCRRDPRSLHERDQPLPPPSDAYDERLERRDAMEPRHPAERGPPPLLGAPRDMLMRMPLPPDHGGPRMPLHHPDMGGGGGGGGHRMPMDMMRMPRGMRPPRGPPLGFDMRGPRMPPRGMMGMRGPRGMRGMPPRGPRGPPPLNF